MWEFHMNGCSLHFSLENLDVFTLQMLKYTYWGNIIALVVIE